MEDNGKKDVPERTKRKARQQSKVARDAAALHLKRLLARPPKGRRAAGSY